MAQNYFLWIDTYFQLVLSHIYPYLTHIFPASSYHDIDETSKAEDKHGVKEEEKVPLAGEYGVLVVVVIYRLILNNDA